MAPPPATRARVLELGCAAGGNLIPMAAAFPEMTCYGVDLSDRQIVQGQSLIDELQLTNVQLQVADLQDLDLAPASFDYVVCHGVFSWVTTSVRDRILALCRRVLSPNGIAYISYNTYPGWHLRQMVREMMTYHTRHLDHPAERIHQARALVSFLIEAKTDDDVFHSLLREERERIERHSDNYIYHEHLEAENHGLYFHEFATMAKGAELQFLGEARLTSMLPNQLPDTTQEMLKRLGPDLIQMEQYLDFIRNRKFRASLLCHREIELDHRISGDRLQPLFVSSALRPEGDGADSHAETADAQQYRFVHPDGSVVGVSDPVKRHTLRLLGEAWPRSMSMGELVSEAVHAAGRAPASSVDRAQIEELILKCLMNDLVEVSGTSDAFVSELSARPLASPLSRAQARRGYPVTSQKHETVHLDELQRRVLVLLDGAHTVAQVQQAVQQLVEDGTLVARPPADAQRAGSPSARESTRRFLDIAAERALLIG